MKYWLITYVFKRYTDDSIQYVQDVCKGSLADKVLYYSNHNDGTYSIVYSQEITLEEYNKLNGQVG